VSHTRYVLTHQKQRDERSWSFRCLFSFLQDATRATYGETGHTLSVTQTFPELHVTRRTRCAVTQPPAHPLSPCGCTNHWRVAHKIVQIPPSSAHLPRKTVWCYAWPNTGNISVFVRSPHLHPHLQPHLRLRLRHRRRAHRGLPTQTMTPSAGTGPKIQPYAATAPRRASR
jgi:hypothetical protein